MKPKGACFYVGQTTHDPETRFKQHKSGYKSNKYAKKYGIRLVPEIFSKFNPIKNEATAPVYTPEPGNGIPINTATAHSPYFSTPLEIRFWVLSIYLFQSDSIGFIKHINLMIHSKKMKITMPTIKFATTQMINTLDQWKSVPKMP